MRYESGKSKIGMKVIFTAKSFYCRGALEDSGKIGKIVEEDCNSVSIYIPGSKNIYIQLNKIPKVTWRLPWDDIRPSTGQLLFAFMYEK